MLLTTDQVAQQLHLHRQTILKMVKAGTLKPANAPRPGAKRTVWRFTRAEILAYRNGHSVPTVTPPTAPTADPAPSPRLSLSDITERLTRIEAHLATLIAMWR
jgi:excisionase family DNA binding protein